MSTADITCALEYSNLLDMCVWIAYNIFCCPFLIFSLHIIWAGCHFSKDICNPQAFSASFCSPHPCPNSTCLRFFCVTSASSSCPKCTAKFWQIRCISWQLTAPASHGSIVHPPPLPMPNQQDQPWYKHVSTIINIINLIKCAYQPSTSWSDLEQTFFDNPSVLIRVDLSVLHIGPRPLVFTPEVPDNLRVMLITFASFAMQAAVRFLQQVKSRVKTRNKNI